MIDLDSAWTHMINAGAGHRALVDWAMINLSQIAVPLLIVSVALQWWWSGNPRAENRHIIVATGLSFGLGLLLNQLILLIVQRPRPYLEGVTHLLISPSSDPSFPSDHATATFAIAAAFLVHREFRRGALFLLAAILVSLSRVYIGTHYLSDVVGGAVTGLLAAILVKLTYRPGTRVDRYLVHIF